MNAGTPLLIGLSAVMVAMERDAAVGSASGPAITWGSPWGLPVQNLWMINHNLWMTYTGVTTRCGEP